MRFRKPFSGLTPLLVLGTLLLGTLSAHQRPAAAQDQSARPNVLFIAVDDLNHWVRHLGRNPQVITPNLDRLARRGVTFSRAYCAAPACNPSRAALMSGVRPSTSGVYVNATDWRPHIPEALTMPTHFRKHGYHVVGGGKIYHGGFDRKGEWDDYLKGEGGDPKPAAGTPGGVGGIAFAPLDCKDEDLADYRIGTWAIEELGKKHDKPFFIACGFHKPHMPWNVPRKYYDLYPLDKIQLPPTKEKDLDDVPAAGVKMAGPQGDHARMLASGRWKEAVQAYLASITYMDMNVGRVLDALDKSPYSKNTIVVLWGDHGWSLGEKEHWRKFALWEEPTRMPLIWSVPGVTKPGGVSQRTVDLMSLYPTLTELCGLPTPSHVEGKSIKPLLANPSAAWSTPALTTHGFGNHALRSEKWRYIRYTDGSEELYDEAKDPYEWTNLAASSEHASAKSEMAKHLPKVNKPAPEGTPTGAAANGRRRRRMMQQK